MASLLRHTARRAVTSNGGYPHGDGSCAALPLPARSHLVRYSQIETPRHRVALARDDDRGFRRYCMPLAESIGDRVFPRAEGSWLHADVGGERFHVGRLVYEGLVNPQKLLCCDRPACPKVPLTRTSSARVSLRRVSHSSSRSTTSRRTSPSTTSRLAGRTRTSPARTRSSPFHNTGSNFSRVRGEGEKLSGGGTSSGLMSFLKVGDRAAGAIKSGGTTRRAAKMVCLDLDHPDNRRVHHVEGDPRSKRSPISSRVRSRARNISTQS